MNNKIAILLGSETDRPTMEAGNKYYEYLYCKCQRKLLYFLSYQKKHHHLNLRQIRYV